MFEAIVEVYKSVSSGSDEVELSDDNLPDSEVESRPCIKEETEDRLVVVFHGMMAGLSEEKSAKFMTFISPKKLGLRLSFRPLGS